MTDIELLPLPGAVAVDMHIPTGVRICAYDAATLGDYARANVEKARIALFQVDTLLLEMSNRANDLGHQLRNTAKVSNTAMGAKLREARNG